MKPRQTPRLVRFLVDYRMPKQKLVPVVMRHDHNLGWYFDLVLKEGEQPTHRMNVLTVAPRVDKWKAWQVEAEVYPYGH